MKISQTVFNLQYMVEMAMCIVQRTIVPKAGKPELQFMCSALCLIVIYICVKFRENIMNGIMLWSGHEYTVEMLFSIFIMFKGP